MLSNIYGQQLCTDLVCFFLLQGRFANPTDTLGLHLALLCTAVCMAVVYSKT